MKLINKKLIITGYSHSEHFYSLNIKPEIISCVLIKLHWQSFLA
ncbi:hypothetical protein XBKQ1_2630036 [Xenorhabdus bovienii str. kraussei Quebec]|uniref:Uncharacterized protein n=1 Tax=Xenorhabdus bovienii str. kraussei Quebec TaxID=1398203 RepID=A0A077PH78_XENBV|nr:hypothetical protein XBKQ1_2630036 [Xenorhabdus bovienii str. kraussei Quebec]